VAKRWKKLAAEKEQEVRAAARCSFFNVANG
jgi:hypothetical protein